MSIRNLDSLFDPRSVAVFGASERAASVGATVWRHLREGGFTGSRWAVNPKHRLIDGEPCHASVKALPGTPDLAVICTPPASVAGLIHALGQRGTRAAIVLTAGLTAAQKQAMLDASRPHLLRILGPDSLGLLAPHARLDASFAPLGASPGELAFVSQSGALVATMLDWAQGRGIGFSYVVSLGEHADVDVGDLLDWLASDPRTRAILLYFEAVEAPRKFMSAARAAARNKPVVVVKGGRSRGGEAAAALHADAPAGSDLVYEAAISRAGLLRVSTLQHLFLAAETLAHGRGAVAGGDRTALERLTLVTNGRGAGVLAADAAAHMGVELATLPSATLAALAALDAALPAHGSHGNPVDMIGNAPVERTVQTMRALLAEPASGTLLYMHAPSAIVPSLQIAQALLPVLRPLRGRVLSCWLGDTALREARRAFHEAGIASYDTPEEAVRGFAMLVTYRRNQEQLIQAPPARPAQAELDLPRVREIVDAVLAEGRELLGAPEAKDLLAACGVPVVASQAAMQALPAARIEGVVEGDRLQAPLRRPQAVELIVGSRVDPLFGPVLLFGQGGTLVDVVADRALALPPLNDPLARALIQRTRVARLLQGWRDVPPADVDAVVRVLIALSQLLADEPRIAEIDINPLLADARGVIALDARVRVSAAAPGGAARFAIRPYPDELVETLQWQGRRLTLRPIRPEDEAQHRAFLGRLAPTDIRMRIFYTRRTIERSELARLTQIDYDREMAFIATAAGPDGAEETLGVARAIGDPDHVEAEFGVMVRTDLKGGGLGAMLMRKLIAHLRRQGTQRLLGTVLRENTRMLDLARALGFRLGPPGSEGTVDLHLPLQ